MAGRWGSLGDVVFKAPNTPNSLSDEHKFGFAVHPLVGRYPRHEATAEEIRPAELTIQLHREFTDPQRVFNALLALAESQEPQQLMIGGDVWGDFVIKKIQRRVEYTDDRGGIISMTLRLSLEEVRDE